MIPRDQSPSYRIDIAILREHGLVAAAVYDVLCRRTGLDGIGPTRAAVAEEAGVALITVRRAIGKLRDAGLLKVEPRFENHRQVSNRYEFPSHYRVVDGGSYEPPLYMYVKEDSVLGPDSVVEPDSSPPESLPHTPQPHSPGDQSRALGCAQCTPGDGSRQVGGAREWWENRPNIFTVRPAVDEVVEAFTAHVNRVGPSRLRKFQDTALLMLLEDKRPQTEILDVIEHAFIHQDRLAYDLDGATDTCNGWDRGLTRLRQVRDFYPDILADLRGQRCPAN
jgi:hypothetical protein